MHKVNLEVFTTQRDLWELESDRKTITEKQLKQVQLNTIHENIREILIRNRTTSGSSNQNRKLLLVFISLVEIMLAIATSFDHNKLHQNSTITPGS
jgi:DnaJ-domain-containing protein 1